MIKLKPFQLSPNTYFGIVVKNRFRKSWWLYVLCFLYSLQILSSDNRGSFAFAVMFFGFIYPPVILVYFYYWATSSKNQALFLEREVVLEDEKLQVTSEGMYSELAYEHIQRVVEEKNYLLLYVAKSQFVYIPKSAFPESSALDEFRSRLKNEA